MTTDDLPRWSSEARRLSIGFLVPTLDEEAHVEDCITSLLDQDYPAELIEVYVIDGGSRDATRQIVSRISERDARVHLLDNPTRTAPAGFNVGLRAATTDIVAITSGHSRTDPGFAATVVEAFAESGALLVGGRTEALPADGSTTARAIARAWGSPFGIGGSRHHYDDEPGWVDTAYPSAYRRELVSAIGFFDEDLVRNQDDDYHLRAAQHGHRMRYDPRIRSQYRPRRTLPALWRQYYDYGYWRAFTLAKHRTVASNRQLVPAVFVAGLAAGPLAWRIKALRRSWLAAVAAYAGLLGAAAFRERSDATPSEAALTSAAVAVIHTAYGAGFWHGAAVVVRRRAGGSQAIARDSASTTRA